MEDAIKWTLSFLSFLSALWNDAVEDDGYHDGLPQFTILYLPSEVDSLYTQTFFFTIMCCSQTMRVLIHLSVPISFSPECNANEEPPWFCRGRWRLTYTFLSLLRTRVHVLASHLLLLYLSHLMHWSIPPAWSSSQLHLVCLPMHPNVAIEHQSVLEKELGAEPRWSELFGRLGPLSHGWVLSCEKQTS